MIKEIRICWLLGLIFFVLIACAKPPTEEMIKAEKAIDEARQNEANTYAQDTYIKAEKSFARAKELVAVMKYDEARSAAGEAYLLAEQAITVSEVNKEKIRTESLKLIEDIQGIIDELKALPDKAFRKQAAVTHAQLQEDIKMSETHLTQLTEELQEGKIKHAHKALRVLKEQVSGQKQNISASLKATWKTK